MTVRERQASVRARRKKRSRRLMIAYALRSAIILLLAFMIVLMIYVALYIKEHLARVPDNQHRKNSFILCYHVIGEYPMGIHDEQIEDVELFHRQHDLGLVDTHNPIFQTKVQIFSVDFC